MACTFNPPAFPPRSAALRASELRVSDAQDQALLETLLLCLKGPKNDAAHWNGDGLSFTVNWDMLRKHDHRLVGGFQFLSCFWQ